MHTSVNKVARLLFPRLNCRQFVNDSRYEDEIRWLIAEGVGGFVLFEGDQQSVAESTRLVRKAAGDRPLLLALDAEFGLRMRLTDGTEFPDMWCWGSANEPELTQKGAAAIALEMRALGLDWNFAPVLDVNTNPANPIVNVRAFGEDPALVAEHGVAYIRGLQENGIIACGKHFPGHGDTAVDSHIGLPVLPFERERLEDVEFRPFTSALRSGVLSVMSAHLAVPAIDPSGDPASLSHVLVSDILRSELGFTGVVVTDALDMGAVVQTYGSEEAVQRAMLAGNDVLEIPDDPVKALQGLRRGVLEDRISLHRVNESCKRLDELVAFREGFEDVSDSIGQSSGTRHEELALDIARRGMKAQATGQLLSIDRPVMALILRDDRGERSAQLLETELREQYNAQVLAIEVGAEDHSEPDLTISERLATASTVILALMIRPRGGAGSVSPGKVGERLIASINTTTTEVVLMNFGNPYLLKDFSPNMRLDAFSASAPSIVAAMDWLKSHR